MNTQAISNGSIIEERKLVGIISERTQQLTGNLTSAYTTNAEVYNGEYEVTPKSIEQSLKTKSKFMSDDVSVHAIPYFEVGNTAGGATVYIGGKIEIE